jgi:hypothetical protein
LRNKIASALTATVAAGGLLTAVATPAEAAVKSTCNGRVCLAADIFLDHDKIFLVNDATVSVTDGIARRLVVFIKNDRWPKGNHVELRKRYKVDVNKRYPKGTLVCGDQVNGTAAACVTI